MPRHADKGPDNKSRAGADQSARKEEGGGATFHFVDNRPEAKRLKRLQEMVNNSPQAKKAAQLQAMISDSPYRKALNEKTDRMFGRAEQRQEAPEKEQLQIQRLPHEALHVLQQSQGRVQPTTQMDKTAIDDGEGSEQEADVMGVTALRVKRADRATKSEALAKAKSLQRKAETDVTGYAASASMGEARLSIVYERSSARFPGTEVVQRQVTQISVDETGKITRVNIVGRPERVFSGTMGDHSTAFSLQVESVRARLESQTLSDAVRALDELVNRAESLFGMGLKENLPPEHRRKLNLAFTRLLGIRETLKGDLEGDDGPAAALNLQEYVNAYLGFRELVPLSVINVKAKSPALAGKGKGEPEQAVLLAAHQSGTEQSPEALTRAVSALFDASSVAMVVAERDFVTREFMAPGLKEEDPEERARAYVRQHLDSVHIAFPKVFEAGLNPQEAESLLYANVMQEAVVWWKRYMDHYRNDIEARRSEEEKVRENLERERNMPGRKRQKDIQEDEKRLADLGQQLENLRNKIAILERLVAGYSSEMQVEETRSLQVATSLPDPGESASGEMAESAEVTEEKLTEEEVEEEEEKKQPLATQVLLASDGTIKEVRSGGRSPSPFPGGTMGAHTTAWVVHVDRIRRAIQEQPVGEALKIMAEQLVPEAKTTEANMTDKFRIDEHRATKLKEARQRLDVHAAEVVQMKDYASATGAFLLQSFINSLLTYINFIPGATLEAGDTGAKREGSKRKVLLAYENDAKPLPSRAKLRWAILGLLDIKEAPPGTYDLLIEHHLDVIGKTYPKSFVNSGVKNRLEKSRNRYETWEKQQKEPQTKKRKRDSDSEGDGESGGSSIASAAEPSFDFGPFAGRGAPPGDQPIVGIDGGILPTKYKLFIDAYRMDVENSPAHLTEAEGDVVARMLRITVHVYQNDMPEGWQIVGNDGGGNCLIHSLVMANLAYLGQEIRPASSDEISSMRRAIAAHLQDPYIIALCATAVMAKVEGAGEAGLGPNVTELLNHPSVPNAKPEDEPVSRPAKKRKTAPSQSEAAAEPAHRAVMGEGEPLQNQAVLHIGGNHWVMIRRGHA